MREKKRGFTLTSLLVTVAIIAIVLAIGIPVYNSYIERSHSAACEHNRAALQSAVTVALLSDRGASAETLTAEINSGDYAEDAVCPDGGKYSVIYQEGSGMTVICSYHSLNQEPDTEPTKQLVYDKTYQDLYDAYHQAVKDFAADNGNKLSWFTTADSGSAEYGNYTVYMTELSKNLAANNVNTWAMANVTGSSARFMWTTYDVNAEDSKFKAGDFVPIISYRPGNVVTGDGQKGTYSVWMVKLTQSKTDNQYAHEFLKLTEPGSKSDGALKGLISYCSGQTPAIPLFSSKSTNAEYISSAEGTSAQKLDVQNALQWYNELVATLQQYDPELYGSN